MNRSFLLLLVMVIFLGAGFGGSFVGGVIYGQSLEDDQANALSPRLGAGQFASQDTAAGGPIGEGERVQGRRGQGAPTGAAQEETADTTTAVPATERQPRQGRDAQASADGAPESGAQGEAGPAQTPTQASSRPASEASPETPGPAGEPVQAPPPGGAGRGGFVGTIAGVEADLMTVSSSRGDVAVKMSGSTPVYEVKEAAPATLTTGTRVRIAGSRNEEGEITAQSVVIVPEGADNLFSSAAGPAGRRRGQ